jgi:hypothetical protein
VLQEIGQPLGSIGSLARMSERHRPRYGSELSFGRRAQPAPAIAHEWIEPPNRSVKSLHGGGQGVATRPIPIKRYDLCHVDTVVQGSDTVTVPGRFLRVGARSGHSHRSNGSETLVHREPASARVGGTEDISAGGAEVKAQRFPAGLAIEGLA